MATWGSQTWGFANWGTLGDVTVTPSGSSLSLSEGSVLTQSNPGWGGQYWGAGEWGDLVSPEVQITGQSLTLTLSSVSVEANANAIIANDNTKTIALANVVAGASAEPEATSQSLSLSQGSVFGGELVVVQVTSASNENWGENAWGVGGWGVGDGQTLSVGSSSIALGQQIFPTAQTLTPTLGSAVAGSSAEPEVTGESLTGSLGSLSFESKYLIGSVQAAVSIASVSTQADANVPVTGQQLTGSTGQLEYEVIYSFSGVQATVSDGFAFGGPNIEVQVRTASAQPWGELTWGDGQWGQSVGTDISQGGEEVAVPSVEVDVTGQQLSSNTGNESITGDANLTLSGISLTTSLGDEDAFTKVTVEVTGNNIGTITIGGFLAGISAEAPVTSVTATTSTGIMSVNAWEVVDPGNAPTWTVVDIAA